VTAVWSVIWLETAETTGIRITTIIRIMPDRAGAAHPESMTMDTGMTGTRTTGMMTDMRTTGTQTMDMTTGTGMTGMTTDMGTTGTQTTGMMTDMRTTGTRMMGMTAGMTTGTRTTAMMIPTMKMQMATAAAV